MKNYKEFQEDVFTWLYGKHKSDPTFTFSMRMRANKGSETNFFIGTEKNKYFCTTFWNIPIGYPGSASDLIDLIFELKHTGYTYYFYFNQTRNPDSEQNRYALEFIRQVKPLAKEQFDNFRETAPTGKFENYTFGRYNIYTSFEPLFNSVEQDIKRFTKLVDDELTKFKDLHPGFKAHRITLDEFDEFYQKLQKRRMKFLTDEGIKTNVEGKNITIEKPKKENPEVLVPKNMPSLNQILYGPPGTGKTYNTINKAIEIASPAFNLNQNRELIKAEYERLVKENQVVFTTFHQSMSYEDFIEGIKPTEPEKEGDAINYRNINGIFKNLCIEASYAIAQLQETKMAEETLDFSRVYDNFAENVNERILNGEKVELSTKTGGKVVVESISQQGNFIIKHQEGTRTYTVSKERLTRLQAVIKHLDDVSNINDKFREIIGGSNASAYWSVLNALKKERQTKIDFKQLRKYTTLEEKKGVVLSLSNSDYKGKHGKPFILIIDEINRGNVSQIFGELITLIEEDKRLGNDEALEVTLPYGKEKFGVPPNLYIIGTMNTADRSVEAIDTALRRRFSFEEMPPKYDLEELQYDFDGTKGSDILRTLNKRIEKLLDKDHQIGHSYFMKEKDEDAKKKMLTAFYKNIIPLLQEYFFGDYGKIGLVLGKGFVRTKSWDKTSDSFAEFDYLSSSEFDDREIFEIVDYRKPDTDYILKMKAKEVPMDFQKAIKLLMKQDIE